ncbi:hypothetical protein [Pandoraea pulmonicola]|uniref:Guanine nucleotide exchange factor SopE GEF domain-containing protein n=2 Tax=Pandoraea pulmonicola TaxID=93221 RepID=A0AAJ4Z853_PANPU|nr:hypothetical protein [Pandoraea pulmonicola]SUA88588.1 Uncharacterised protein [Pandoraea pulmonicola]
MQIFRTGHDVRAYARNHDGVSLRRQRAEDTEIVRNMVQDFSENPFFLERLRSSIVYLHRQLNFGTGDVELSAPGVAVFLSGTGEPSPEREQLERMSASLIRLCTRRHATFDKIFYGESHLPRHIAEIVRDLADLVSVARNRRVTAEQGPSSSDPFAQLTEHYERILAEQRSAYQSSSFSTTSHEMPQVKGTFVSVTTNQTERDELSLQRERAQLPMDHMIFDAVNDGLTAMEGLIFDVGKDEIGKRQIIDSFYSELYGNEREKFAPEIKDKGRRNEYLRNIGLVAQSAGLSMAEEGSNGSGIQKPKGLGVNVFQTVVTKSYHDLKTREAGPRINEMEPEIRRRIQEEGLRLIAPMAKEFGYPDAATFRSELRAVASDYGVAPAITAQS